MKGRFTPPPPSRAVNPDSEVEARFFAEFTLSLPKDEGCGAVSDIAVSSFFAHPFETLIKFNQSVSTFPAAISVSRMQLP